MSDSKPDLDLENLWEMLLSRQPEQVRLAFQGLSDDEQLVVLNHLHRMVGEPGWHAEQVISARLALQAIDHQ